MDYLLNDFSAPKVLLDAEALHLLRQLDAIQTFAGGNDSSRTINIAGSTTIITDAKYGHKLNRTVGIGMTNAFTTVDLEVLERHYQTIGLYPEIHVCQCSDGDTINVLKKSEYRETKSVCTFVRKLVEAGTQSKSPAQQGRGPTVTQEDDNDLFESMSLEGFKSNGRDPELLRTLAKCAVNRSDTKLFIARIDGHVAGTAAMAILQVGTEKIANLYIDSTLPSFRSRGVQHELIRARLALAQELGCICAMASAQEGSASGRNFQRAGFELAMRSSIFSKDVP